MSSLVGAVFCTTTLPNRKQVIIKARLLYQYTDCLAVDICNGYFNVEINKCKDGAKAVCDNE